ncbi:MAG: penicillin acylase family protein [Deltaproteobacteria bacterium]|nr:penicillin acylase family protein [Deltaproteobacteria bacterium]
MVLERKRIVVLVTVALAALIGANAPQSCAPPYMATVRWTSYGIPHVRASNWGSLGYGYGYAFARDNLCVLAEDVVEANGELSRYFGPAGGNLQSDLVWALVNSDEAVQSRWEQFEGNSQELLRGYARGYNRFLRDTGVSGLATPCRDATWVRPIDERDLVKTLAKLNLRAGVANFIDLIVAAAPPAPLAAVESAQPATAVKSAAEARRLLAQVDLPEWNVHEFGSNAVALGRDLTNDGGGALLGNPHFPWLGISRFHAVHLTIPGRYDAMGAAIYGFPLISIGFNRHVAWSHTVSTARRFVLRELTLAAGDPTSYVYDGAVVPMTTDTVTVQVLQPDDSLAPVSHTFYSSQWGPMLILPPLAFWTATNAYTLHDVNTENMRGLAQYQQMGSARSMDEFVQAIETHVALPWVNTIAADRDGNAYYGDISTVPHVTDAKLAACANTFVAQVLSSVRVYTLDGSTSACDLGTDADSPQAGIFGASNLPGIRRNDFAQNSNNSYWLANPAQPLEGFPQIIGTDEGGSQGLRTRLGLTQIEDRMSGPAGLPGSGFDRQWLQDVLFQNRHHSAELLLDGVRTLCDEEDNDVDLGGGVIVDVSEACAILGAWDATNDLDRVGPHIWREFWNRVRNTPNLWAVPFDASDPVHTPRDLNVGDPAVRAQAMADLAGAVQRLADGGIPLNSAWGEVQFDTRADGSIIPIHGGDGGSGVYNAIGSGGLVDGVGYTPVFAGSSYIQTVSWEGNWPEVRSIVTYSQSTDPDSPHFSDMTHLFSEEGWIRFPYQMGDILADPELETRFLGEPR